MKIIDNLKDTLVYERTFKDSKDAIELVRFNKNYDKVTAIHDISSHSLRFFKEYDFKRNDKFIDMHDNVYYVDEVIRNQPYLIKPNKFNMEEKEFNTLVVTYKKQEIQMPDSLRQCITIKTNINIDAQNSTFNGTLANYSLSQNATYLQILDFMKLLCNNTFHVKELQPFVQGVEVSVQEKKPVKEKWYKSFFKFMGTQLFDIAKQFLIAYSTSFISK